MLILLTIVYIIVCLFLIVVVLLQSGKAADLAGAFGGMGRRLLSGRVVQLRYFRRRLQSLRLSL